MSAWGPSTYSISRVISSWAWYQPRSITAALSPKDASVSWMVFSLMVSLLPVGLCTCRLAPRGRLSAPPGRPLDGRPGPGGVHTRRGGSPRAGGRCSGERFLAKGPLAHRDPCLPSELCAGSWRRVASRPSHRALRPSRSFLMYAHRALLLYISPWGSCRCTSQQPPQEVRGGQCT